MLATSSRRRVRPTHALAFVGTLVCTLFLFGACGGCGDPGEVGTGGSGAGPSGGSGGGGTGNGGTGGTGNGGTGGTPSENANLELGIQLPVVLQIEVERAAKFAIDNSGNAVGTLTEGQGYEPTPNDRLIIRNAQGETVLELVMNSQYDFENRQFVAYTTRGTFVRDQVSYQFELQYQRQASGFQSREIQEQVRGNVTADGFNLTISRDVNFELLGSVANSDERWAHRWEAGGSSFVWNNVMIRVAIQDGSPVDIDQFWVAQGVLTQDGTPVARIERIPVVGGQRIVIRFESGREDVTLLSF